MTFIGKVFALSLIVLVGSFLFYRFVVPRITDDEIISGVLQVNRLLMTIDGWLSSIRINGFYRGSERILSSLIYYSANTSGLNVDRRVFKGVEVYIFDPTNDETNRPAIVYFHGGGWMLFNPKFYSRFTAELARRLNTLVVSVNYRKSPENPFPDGVNDAIAATQYFLANCEKYDVNPNRIALMGDSAGGNLVMAVGAHLSALKKLQPDIRVPKMLFPLCPSVQMIDFATPSFLDNNDDVVLHRSHVTPMICLYAFGHLSSTEMAHCSGLVDANGHVNAETLRKVRPNIDWSRHLSGPGYDARGGSKFVAGAGDDAIVARFSHLVMDPLFSPLSAMTEADLKALPPVYLLAGKRDPLLDDARLLAARLAKVGRLAVFKEYDHYHVSFVFATFGSAKSREVFEELVKVFSANGIL